MSAARLRVLCVTPSGLDGKGGIDRLYYYVRSAGLFGAHDAIDLRFAAARGQAAIWPLAFPGRLLAIARELRAWRPDIVHINFANRGSALRKYAVLRLAQRFGARTVVHLHDMLPETAPARRLFLAICRRADRVVVLGRLHRDALERLGLPAAKLAVVLNGIPDFAADLAVPKPAGEVVSILFAGQLGHRKGIAVVLDALALLGRRDVEGWRCTVAGDGDAEPFKAQADRNGIADRVRFTGWLDAHDVHALMREAGIVVLPSVAEALPLSLAEGACAGAALVATPVGNVGEIVREGETGRLVAREPQALAAALGDLLADRRNLARLQLGARRLYRETLTVEAFAEGLRAVYTDLASGRGTASASMPAGAGAGVAKPHETV